MTYFLWKAKTGSLSRSDKSIPLPFALTSGCFLHSNHPTCAKKKPLFLNKHKKSTKNKQIIKKKKQNNKIAEIVDIITFKMDYH